MIVNIIMFFTMYPVLLVLSFLFPRTVSVCRWLPVCSKHETGVDQGTGGGSNCGKVPQRDETVFYFSADRSA